MRNEKGNTKYKILNVECPISNVEVNSTSTFTIRYSIFDISFFPFSFLCLSFLILHFKLLLHALHSVLHAFLVTFGILTLE